MIIETVAFDILINMYFNKRWCWFTTCTTFIGQLSITDILQYLARTVCYLIFLLSGFRHIKLRNEAYQPLCLPTLFVEIVTKDYVPESLNGKNSTKG